MGTEALNQMAGNKKIKGLSKHEKHMKEYMLQKKIGFTTVVSPVTLPTSTPTSLSSDAPSSTESTSTDTLIANDKKKQMTFRTSGNKDKIKAEILLAMKAVSSHIPQRSLDDFYKLAMKMFPDSQIAYSPNRNN